MLIGAYFSFHQEALAVLALRKISKTLYQTQAIRKLMSHCRAQVLQFLEKQGKQPLLHPINPHMLPQKGQFPAGTANKDVKLYFAVSTQPREPFGDARGFSSLSHWHTRKENLADSRQSPVTGPCKLTAVFSLASDTSARALAAEMPLPHVRTSFPSILLVSSLNTTLTGCTEIDLCDTNSGHTEDAKLWLLGNKTPRYHLSCCWEPLSYLFLEDTMENEYKHSLQRIEYGEEIRHDDCAFINIHESECPGQS